MYLWQLIRNKLLFVIWLCVVAPPALGLAWVKEHHPKLTPSPVMWIIIPGYLFYCASAFYIFFSTVHHLDEDPALSLREALKRSFTGLRSLLRFVPVLGALFEPDEDRTRYDPDDE